MTEKSSNFRTNNFILITVSVILYRALLELIYVKIIYRLFAYQYYERGYQNLFSGTRCFFSWALLIPIPFLIYRNTIRGGFSRLAWTIILCISYIPSLVMFEYNRLPFYIWYLVYFTVFALAVELIKPIYVRKNPINRQILLIAIAIVLVFSVWFIWIQYTGCHIQLSILDVYDTRAEAAARSIPTILSYIFSMGQYVLPMFIVYALYRRNYIMMFLFMFTQYICFCIDGSKTSFFLAVLLVGLYLFHVIVGEHFKNLTELLVIGSTFGLFEYKLIGSFYIASFGLRRVMFLPNLLNNFYYDFFSKNPYDYFRQSLVKDSIYDESISLIIGRNYLLEGSNANNGLFSDAWANLGVVGVFIMPVLVVIVLKLFDGATRNLPEKVYLGCVIEVTFLFISSSFFTILLSHGMALLIIVLYLMNNMSAPVLSYDKKE